MSASLRFLTASSHIPEAMLPGSRQGQWRRKVKVRHLWRLTPNQENLVPKGTWCQVANETHHDSDDKGSDRERRKAFFLLLGQKTCLALGIADDVAGPAHLRRGKACRPEWRKI